MSGIFPGGGSNPSGLITQQFTITSAQLLAGTPVTLVAAPGASSYWNILSVEMQYKFNTTAYTPSGDELVVYAASVLPTLGTADGNYFQIGQIGFIDQPSSQVASVASYVVLNTDSANQAQTVVANQPLSFASKTTGGAGPPTAGNGTLIVTVTYQSITLS
jgi:hypothetical protein